MKTFTKVCLVLSGILGGVGLAFCIAAVSMGVTWQDIKEASPLSGYSIGWNSDSHSLAVGKKSSQDLTDIDEKYRDIEKLDIDIGVAEMVIEEYDGEEIHFTAENVPKDFKCVQDGKELIIEEDGGKIWGINIGGKTPKLTLRVPKNTAFKEADFTVGVGSMKIYGIEVKEASIDCGVGSVTMEGKITGDASLNTGVGNLNMELEGSYEDFNYDIDCGVGNVKVDGHRYSALSDDEEVDNHADKDMDIECGVGNTVVKFKD